MLKDEIKGAYHNVNYDILISILKKRMFDPKFLKLLYQKFQCGLLDHRKIEDTLLGVSQGGTAGPILLNIYMHEFDEFIFISKNVFFEKKRDECQKYIDSINTVENRTYKPRNKTYDVLETKLTRLRNRYKKFIDNCKYLDLNEQKK